MEDPSFESEFRVRFRDMDALGHVNNAVYATYFEIVRGEYYHAVIGDAFEEYGAVMVHLEIDYHAPLSRFDPVIARLDLADLGESSIRFEYALVSAGETAAAGETVQVVADPETGESVPIPGAWRDRMRAHESADNG